MLCVGLNAYVDCVLKQCLCTHVLMRFDVYFVC